MTILEYFSEHWVQAFLWGFACFVVSWTGLHVACSTLRRFMRMLCVLIRGWPPSHLDADGDWKPEPKE